MNLFRKIYEKFQEDYKRRALLLRNRGLFSYLAGSAGYVLVTVIIITTLLMTISGDFIIISITSMRYMKKIDDRAHAGYFAMSGMELAQMLIKLDNRGQGNMMSGISAPAHTDSFFDDWAQGFPPAGIPGMFGDFSLRINITDENAKINTGAFADKSGSAPSHYYHMAAAFFEDLGLDSDYPETMLDWVDPDDSRSPYGAESGDYYQTLTPPYFAKNGPMDSIDELLLLKNFTPKIFYGTGGGNYGMEGPLVDSNRGELDLDSLISKMSASTGMNISGTEYTGTDSGFTGRESSRRLSDYFRVHGTADDYYETSKKIKLNSININTAPFRVLLTLRALSEDITEDVVWEIVSRRKQEPFTSVSQIKDIIGTQTAGETVKMLEKVLGVQSNIFKITSEAEVAGTRLRITGYYNRGRAGSERYLYWCQE